MGPAVFEGVDFRETTHAVRMDPAINPAFSEKRGDVPLSFDSMSGGDELHDGMTFRSIARLESNAEAFDMARMFSRGLISFAAVIGVSGVGKSRLLEATSTQLCGSLHLKSVPISSATDWITNRAAQPSHVPLILDDVQDVLHRASRRLQFQLAIERRVKAGRPTMLAFTANAESDTFRVAMPLYREWIVSKVGPPTFADLETMVTHVAREEHLDLSARLAKVIARWLQGNGRTLVGALKRLKLHGSTWSDSQGTLRACGVLNPYLVANPQWDLRDAILDAARQVWVESKGDVTATDLALYGMLRIAQLSEADVARYMCLEPGKTYQRAIAFEDWLMKDADGPTITQRLADRIVESLLAV